ncbi:447_t:CDS:2 [Acaulospora morrowiae]|uniref:447_t:CDS:1 n=1 Tax=Acaulospora morrowiae TaxID=94023 RepID=A0A9N8ZWE9_9GLOM|nr:447_t:CDS:2 [Acaulospora morrowiae]
MSDFRKRAAKPLWSKNFGMVKDGPIKIVERGNLTKPSENVADISRMKCRDSPEDAVKPHNHCRLTTHMTIEPASQSFSSLITNDRQFVGYNTVVHIVPLEEE